LWREDVLWESWRQVKENKGAPGIDGVAIDQIVDNGQEGEIIFHLQKQLRDQVYQFTPVRRVMIPKPNGGTRPLGIATSFGDSNGRRSHCANSDEDSYRADL
jgi:retron-type reverse transcriptase